MRRWAVDNQPGDAELDAVAEILLSGGVVLLPTDTIYGLHAVATDASAVGTIAAIKGRDDTKPFVVVASNRQQLEALGAVFSAGARDVVDALWPAPLTAIVPLREAVPASRGVATLAVRVPALQWLRRLTDRTGPLASTSANRSGEKPASEPSELAAELLAALAAVVDAGPLKGKPSVIVDFTGTSPNLVREGDPVFTQTVWKTLRKTL